jgi:hypothetical protein
MHPTVICLTATIAPNTIMVERADVATRLNDYKTCIDFYLRETDLPVIFAENSGYELTGDPDFERFLKSPRFSIQRYQAHPNVHKGKGFQEFFMLDQVVKNLPEGTILVKITGRYLVRNIASILASLSAPLHIDLHRKKAVAITGMFAVDRSIYLNHFKGKYAEADDARGHFIEHVLYQCITRSDLIMKSALLPENPVYEGTSGSHGHSMARNKYKMKLRSIERFLSRKLGIRKFLIEY